MRRDNVFKIICNHQITEHLRLKERTINSFIWGCKDFSENPNGEDQIFVIKFKVILLEFYFFTENSCNFFCFV